MNPALGLPPVPAPLLPRPLTMGAHDRDTPMAKPNYSFEKRQRELAKKKKQDEKDAQKRAARDAAKAPTGDPQA